MQIATTTTRRGRIVTGLVAAAMVGAMFAVASPGVAQAAAAVDPGLEKCLLDLHNQERVSRGLAPLVLDAGLTEFARDWSFEMRNSGNFKHSNLKFPGSWRMKGENISWSYGHGHQCASHHKGFMESEGHRNNILNPRFDRVGIGIVFDGSANSKMHVTVALGDSDGSSGPSPVPPFPASPCVGVSCDGFAAVDTAGRWTVFAKVGDNHPKEFYFGNPGDFPFMGDWDGDGEKTPGLYRQSDGFVYLRDSNTQGPADTEFYFGNPGDVPIVGDWDGDGKDTVSIYRPSEGRFYIINKPGTHGGGLGAADFSFQFGNIGDTPFVGDFDGNGKDSIGLYRESTGYVYFRNKLSTGIADSSFYFGIPGDRILAGDWNGKGKDTVAIYRPGYFHLHVNLVNAPGIADWDAYIGPYHKVVSG